MLTTKQIAFLEALYAQTNINVRGISFRDFVYDACEKTLEELVHSDVNVIKRHFEKDIPMTTAQKSFLKEVAEYCHETLHENLSVHDFKSTLQRLKTKHDLFVPAKIYNDKIYDILNQTDDYIVARQHNARGSLLIMAFKQLLVCDWDNLTLEEVTEIIERSGLTFRIYKTYNGYHGYCTSKAFAHGSFATLQLMYQLKCDNWYISFTKVNGFVVRLQKKLGRDESYIEKFERIMGNDEEREDLIQLVHVKDTALGFSES
jgi:hypothetical protein